MPTSCLSNFHFRALAAVGVLSLSSCGSISSIGKRSAENRLQVDDVMTAGSNLAMTLYRSTAVAAVRQPVTTTKIGFALLWNRPREIVVANSPIDLSLQPTVAEAPGSAEFEQMLDQKKFPAAKQGTLKYLVDGPGFFPELDRQMADAKKSIDVQVFIFDNDDIAVRYADKLRARSAEVKTRVLFDDMGSTFAATAAPETPAPEGFSPPPNIAKYLRHDSKVRARRTLNPWLVADHTKVFVFDDRTALLGGMNIGREYYSEWHDLMVRVEGPVVSELGREFSRAWRKAGPWGDFALFRQPEMFQRRKPPGEGGIPLRVLRTDPAEGLYDIQSATLLAIRGAKKRIWIENPYFAQEEIVLATAAAARRGVDVRVIIPSRGDSGIMDSGNLATARVLIQAGAKVLRYPRMTHMKVMICDGWASLGSANLDTLSMRVNRELNLAFSDPAAVRALEKAVFQPDFRRSRRVKLSETNSVVDGLISILAKQL